MSVNIIEHMSAAPLIALIDEMQKSEGSPWGVARIKRDYLRPMTTEAFLFTIQPVLQGAEAVNVFFIGSQRIYVAWQGPQNKIFKQLRNFVGTVLTQPGSTVDFSVFVTYIDPHEHGEELKKLLKDKSAKLERGGSDQEINREINQLSDDPAKFNEANAGEEEEEGVANPNAMVCTAAQRERFAETCSGRPYRKQMEVLVVEDQVFSQKLLCEIIRSARFSGHDAPTVDVAAGLHDAWKIYLKKAHDLVFVDLGLVDGSGHALARAIKELDPGSGVIIVTANNYEEELDVARQNNVDGFIAKPYNKKQILDCIERYAGPKGPNKGARYGAARQF